MTDDKPPRARATTRDAGDGARRGHEWRDRHRALMALVPDGVFIHDDAAIQEANRAAADLAGLDRPEDLAGRALTDFIHPESRAAVRAYLDGLPPVAGPMLPPEPVEIRMVTAVGTVRWAELSAVRAVVAGGAVFQTLVRDTGARRLARQALEDLMRSNAELEQFAHVVSHDVRAPLRAIHNYGDFLAEDLAGTLAPETEAALSGLRRAVRQAEELVGDLLALSRVGRRHAPLETVDAGALVRGLVADLQAGSDAEITVGDGWPMMRTVPVLLIQILQNLLSNAIKFNNPPRKVTVACRPAGPGRTEFIVADNGMGMEAHDLDRIFRIFHRLQPTTEYQGTGIGLPIVQKAAAELGGTVTVESCPGKGSTFHVVLPLDPDEAP